MSAVGTKLRSISGANGYRGLAHWCPGCEEVHVYKIDGPGPTKWTFNGDYERPSFTPSMLISTDRTLCHYFIKTGSEILAARAGVGAGPLQCASVHPDRSYIDFCGDSPHALRGQIVELPDWPYAPGTYGGIDE